MPHRLTSEEALEVLDVMDVAVLIADIINGGSWVTWVNPAFTRTFGYTLEEMVSGGGVHRMIGANTDEGEIQRMYHDVLRGNRSTITSVGYCADGSEFWSTFTASPVIIEGRVVRWIGVQHDVSDQVRRSERARRSYEIERRARIGLSVVAEVSELMAGSDDPAVLRVVAKLLRRRLISWAGFFVVDGTGLREIDGLDADETGPRRSAPSGPPGWPDDPIVVAADSAEARSALDLHKEYPAGSPAAQIVARLRSHREAHQAAGDRAIVVPMVGRRSPLGVLVVLPRATDSRVAESFGEIAAIADLVARRVGLAMENARFYSREHRLAETLQRAMLPEQAHVAGLDVWTFYAPNVEHAQVGGDWYDVVHVSDDTVGVVIGDVTGHDVEAAAMMGQLRSIVRAYACELVDPATVLSRVDRLVAGTRFDRYATLAYAAMKPVEDGWAVTYTLAGHLPPLLVRDGVVKPLEDGAGLLVGCSVPVRTSGSVHARAGDVIVFYTDGLVERRDRTLRDGVEALSELCARLTARDAASLGEEIVAGLGDSPEDDVAVVVVRVPDPAVDDVERAHLSRRWQLPAERRSVGRARHAVLGALAAWGVEDTQSVELVVSELVANAVLHAWGQVGLDLAATDHGLRIEVTDSNPTPPAALRGKVARAGGYGMHIVGRLAEWGWQPLEGGGKVVWAVVRPRDGRASDGPASGGIERRR